MNYFKMIWLILTGTDQLYFILFYLYNRHILNVLPKSATPEGNDVSRSWNYYYFRVLQIQREPENIDVVVISSLSSVFLIFRQSEISVEPYSATFPPPEAPILKDPLTYSNIMTYYAKTPNTASDFYIFVLNYIPILWPGIFVSCTWKNQNLNFRTFFPLCQTMVF